MPTSTSHITSTPGFVVDQNTLARNTGRVIDFDATADSRKNATTQKKEIPAGTLMAELATGKIVPRADVEQTVSTLTQNAGTATATVAAHGYQVGDVVRISGAEQAEYNGLQTILTVPDANSFTFAVDSGATTCCHFNSPCMPARS